MGLRRRVAYKDLKQKVDDALKYAYQRILKDLDSDVYDATDIARYAAAKKNLEDGLELIRQYLV